MNITKLISTAKTLITAMRASAQLGRPPSAASLDAATKFIQETSEFIPVVCWAVMNDTRVVYASHDRDGATAWMNQRLQEYHFQGENAPNLKLVALGEISGDFSQKSVDNKIQLPL